MSQTHDYTTKTVKVRDLDNTHTLVGESGGLSSVYDNHPSNFAFGLQGVDTEHGQLLLDPDAEVEVLDQ